MDVGDFYMMLVCHDWGSDDKQGYLDAEVSIAGDASIHGKMLNDFRNFESVFKVYGGIMTIPPVTWYVKPSDLGRWDRHAERFSNIITEKNYKVIL